MDKTRCCQCESSNQVDGLYGYPFCRRCQTQLNLFTDATISKHVSLYEASKPNSYEAEVLARLQAIEKNFGKQKVKLLHILDRLSELE